MKWIKSRTQFLSEATIRDVIFPRQAKEVAKVWGEKFLDYTKISATPKIQQIKRKLTEEDKRRALGVFFDCNINEVFALFENVNDKFATVIAGSIDTNLYDREDAKIIMKDFNIKNPTIDQMVFLFESVFRKISASETLATEIVQKDENNRPIRDEQGNLIKIKKEKGAVVYSTNNLVNINAFLEDFNRCFPEDKLRNSYFQHRELSSLVNMAKIDENRQYTVDFEIFNKDLYISISHDPKDILNMSISKFYASCQHLYTGGYRTQVLGNVFDPNSIPAFLTFETPIFWNDEKISDQLPLSRMIIRNIENFDDSEKPKIFFDRAYPDRMKDIFGELIEKYTENKQTVSERDSLTYIFTPDVDADDDITTPYMDRLSVDKKPYIGVNTRSLYLNRLHDWKNCRVSPDAKIKELIIETTDIPENLSQIKLELDWVKFKFLKINTLKNFDKIKSNSFAFDRCVFNNTLIDEISTINPQIEKLQFVSCDIKNDFNFSNFKNLKELHLSFGTVNDTDELLKAINGTNIKKLVISGDIVRDQTANKIVEDLRRKGINVTIEGPKKKKK